MELKLNLIIKLLLLTIMVIIVILLGFHLIEKFKVYYEAAHFKDDSADDYLFSIHCLWHRGTPHTINTSISEMPARITYCEIGPEKFVFYATKKMSDSASQTINMR